MKENKCEVTRQKFNDLKKKVNKLERVFNKIEVIAISTKNSLLK